MREIQKDSEEKRPLGDYTRPGYYSVLSGFRAIGIGLIMSCYDLHGLNPRQTCIKKLVDHSSL